MSTECFREAVRSLVDWPGIVGIFGGNPCVHPQFEQICDILCEEIPEQKHRGLWSNDLMKHGALCRKVFYPEGRFNLNAHGIRDAYLGFDKYLTGKAIRHSDTTQAQHAAMLASFEDFGVPLSEWIEARENCDINQKWSGAIVERSGKPFAYFCEVAAAIDGVLGLNRGMPVAAGWWKHTMDAKDFDNQVAICNVCAVPLRMKGRPDREERYDVSPSWRDLKPRGRVGIVVHETMPERVKENTDYMGVRK